jgi:hypothetical protein
MSEHVTPLGTLELLVEWHTRIADLERQLAEAQALIYAARKERDAAEDAEKELAGELRTVKRQLAEAREVKPLEWNGIGGDYAARAPTGFAGVTYRAEKTWDIFCLVFSVPGMELGILGKFPTLEAAKAAAQADFTARILSALKGPTP